ncbi:hypothetical protein L9F63_024875, partial [Diploptera punctata]
RVHNVCFIVMTLDIKHHISGVGNLILTFHTSISARVVNCIAHTECDGVSDD